ncbi:hypothetical protein BDV41DRAFT_95663 [Aspergillus transmontanensis]|uniref:Rhodopsin domain-containing protein n=1 Tax=Aspergillus transmontanensis TaxID=1034304 RepID=A0A5N6WA71_9EURO|nr:hypothetical protein BDV41DRAFT_95663 [Aspergillus transmontanensis]
MTVLDIRGLYPEIPPNARTKADDNPTLLVSWWATGFSLAIIVVRVCGRYIRIERFFREDKVMMLAIIPLLIRMALVHVILIWGTNNTKTAGLTAEEIQHRIVGSKLVLVSRICYAIFIWTAKFTPFNHYWQVVPDPGAQCRSGYANLITMGVCDVITDLLLVAFPIPLIMMTHMPAKRKALLVILFALSLILVGITCYRVPSVISHQGSQQYRSLLASLEILAATAVSNAIVIGSFVRDKGVKKAKFKKAIGSASVSESMDHSSVRRTTITHHHWGSDSDLAGDLGIRLHPDLVSSDHKLPRPAPVVAPCEPFAARTGTLDPNWSFNRHAPATDDDRSSTTGSLDIKVSPHEYLPTNKTPRKASGDSVPSSPGRVSMFDVGGLLDPSPRSSPPPTSHIQYQMPPPGQTTRARSGSAAFLHDVGGLLSTPTSGTPPNSSPNFSRPGGLRSNSYGRRRGSSVHFSDTPESPAPPYRSHSDVTAPIPEGSDDVELQDVGGLLSKHS